MWVGKFRIKHDDWILDKTLKYDLTATGIPLNSYKKDGNQYHTGMVFLKGEEKNKAAFINSLKKDRRIKDFKAIGSQLFVLIEAEDHIAPRMPKEVFFLKPVYFEKGYEYWELGSWKREPLEEFYIKSSDVAEISILRLHQESPTVFVQHEVPKLTDLQRRALELAVQEGYYDYPRKNSVEELAKIAKMPRTTFQEHLRKAESKLMHILVNSLE